MKVSFDKILVFGFRKGYVSGYIDGWTAGYKRAYVVAFEAGKRSCAPPKIPKIDEKKVHFPIPEDRPPRNGEESYGQPYGSDDGELTITSIEPTRH
jgi:hypothetical protein